MQLPTKITPCPIVEANIEIRFDSQLPEDAIFGVVYNVLKDDFPKYESLPILQLPQALRVKDSNLLYRPYYKLSAGNFISQIGPKVFSLAVINEYCGWDTFYKEIGRIFKKMFGVKIIEKVTRLGLRYINVFADSNVFEKSDLKVALKGSALTKKMNLGVELPGNNGFINVVRMVSEANVDASGKRLLGSVIDIDTKLREMKLDFYDNMDTILNWAHLEEKMTFFNLLNSDYIKTLNPEY